METTLFELKMYQIFVTPKNTRFKAHFWTEGGFYSTKKNALFQVNQMKKTKIYSKIEILKIN